MLEVSVDKSEEALLGVLEPKNTIDNQLETKSCG